MSTAPDDATALATRGFVYGFPLVFNLEQVARYVTTGVGANPAAPFNSFSHARSLAGPADRFVTINNDTVYSMAQLDLSAGPLLLEVPAVGERYYVLQFIDAWTNNFAYIGTRATGSDAGRFLLVPPGWSGEPPAGTTVVRVPTVIASIVGRWAVTGDTDLPAVHALQDATTLTPMGSGTPQGLPSGATDGLSPALAFWEAYRVASQAFPPPARDVPLQESLAGLGLTGDVPVGDLGPEQRDALTAGHDAGRALLDQATRGGHTEVRDGWHLAYHVFDYNLDHFEVGALDDPEWQIADPQERLVIRAAAALGGLWGNHGYEAAYSPVYVDADGEQLTGERSYSLRLETPPPNDAFWSLTMYDVPDYFLVDNPAGRYSIGDRTPGLVHDDDGSLTLHVSAEEPTDPVRRANWLPAPAGPFRPILRVYAPRREFLDGSYRMPPFRVVDAS